VTGKMIALCQGPQKMILEQLAAPKSKEAQKTERQGRRKEGRERRKE
jgi:hypothetical protein